MQRVVSITVILSVGLLILLLLAGCLSNPLQSNSKAITGGFFAFTPSFQATTQPAGDNSAVDQQEQFNEGNEQIILVEEIVIVLLFVAVLVGIVANRMRVPYTVGLVLMGLALTLSSNLEVRIPPNLILALLVPPLLFEAAFHINLDDLRHDLAPILALAVPGVLLTTLVVGGIVAWGTQLSFTVTLIFGALISATDPVSVVALFRSVGVPRRLQVILEGESLLNDGTAIVVFRMVTALSILGFSQFNPLTGILDFLKVAGGGLAIGLVLGALVSQMIARIDDYLIETTLTSVLAYGAFLIAEEFGVSGVLAVVAAGLINGNIGAQGMSPTTRIVIFNFWEYAAFLANSFIFLLIGLRIDLDLIFEHRQLIVWSVAAVLLSRAIVVYGLSWIGRKIPVKWQHVLNWGGLRGAISLALALSLPASLGAESIEAIQVMAFGVVLFTLLVQGFTIAPLVRFLKLAVRSEAQEEYERRHARAAASRIAYEHLKRRNRQGLLSDHTWKALAPVLEEHNETLANSVREVLALAPDVEAEELDTARREALRAQRSALSSLMKDGVISNEVYSQLVSEVDTALMGEYTGWHELFGQAQRARIDVDRMMAVVIQEQDVENAISTLTKIGIAITTLPSTGGFLNQRNATLLIGFAKGQELSIVHGLRKSCRRRVEYLATPLEGALSYSEPIPITVGGATIFVFDVERFETF